MTSAISELATCHIIAAMKDTEYDIGCLIGIGHHHLADRLRDARAERDSANREWAKFSGDVATAFLAAIAEGGEMSAAAPEEDAAWERVTKATAEVNAVMAEVTALREKIEDGLRVGAYAEFLGY